MFADVSLAWRDRVPLRKPTKLALPLGGSGPQSNAQFLGPILVNPQTVSRSVHPFLHRLPVCPTDTDHAASVARGRISVTHV